MTYKTGEDLLDGWNAYRRQVMDTLKRLGVDIDRNEEKAHEEIEKLGKELWNKFSELDDELQAFRETTGREIAVLKTKAALLGTVGGALLGGGMALLVEFLKK